MRSRGTKGRRSVWPLLALFVLGPVPGTPVPRAAGQDVQKELQDLGRPLLYEVSVILKLIQVSVVNKKGQPVRDLTKDDFLVFDNGRPVEITAFERHSIRSGPDAPEERGAAPKTAARTAEAAAGMNRKFFLFFDFAFNNARGIARAKEAALDFLDTKVGPEDEAAVLTYSMVRGLRVQEYLTRDLKKVRETIDLIDRRAASGRASEIEEKYWREATEGTPGIRESAAGEGSGRPGSEYSWERQEAKRIAQVFILRLTDLAKALRYVQGRKDFLFFSSGVPSSMIYGAQAGSAAAGRTRFDPGDNVLRDQNESMLREFAASDCAFYAFDSREAAKVASLFTYDEQTFASGYRDLFTGSGVFGDQTNVFKDEQFTGRNSLQRLSQTTGGKYFGNIDTYERSLAQVQDLTGTYYVLGFSVPEKEDGQFHEIRVELKRRGLEVRGASGYFNPKPFREFSDLERKLHLFDLAMNERAFSRLPEGFPMSTLPVALSDLSGLIVLGRLPMSLAGKLAGGPLEFISITLDAEDNIFDMQRIETPGEGTGSYLFQAVVAAGPGVYRCRLVIRNTITGAAAVSSVSGTTVEAGRGKLRAQPPLVFAPRSEIVRRLTSPGSRLAGRLGLTELYPLSSGELVPVLGSVHAGGELTVVIPCESPAGAMEDLAVNAQVIDLSTGDRIPAPFFLKGRERRGNLQIIHLGIPAGSLRPGSYMLYVHLQGPASGETAYGRVALSLFAD